MVHSGPAGCAGALGAAEKPWRNLENQAKHLTRGTEDMRHGVADMVRGNVTELRKGYARLASALREPRSESIWSQVRISLGRLVPGGRRTSDCVAGSVEDLTDAAMVGTKKARLERTRTERCTTRPTTTRSYFQMLADLLARNRSS
jgi:hypothetical protein